MIQQFLELKKPPIPVPLDANINSEQVIWVQPQTVGFVKGAQWVEVVTPLMYIADSKIPSIKKWGAQGVYFGEFVPRNTVVGVYGGPAITREYALETVRKDFWMDDHLQKVGPQKGGFVHDSRVTDTYPISYYVDNGMIGSLVNDALGSGLPVNVVVEFYDGPYQHPNGQVVDGLCVFKTCVDCREGDEALRNYGPTHRLCHFDLQQSERDADLEKAKDMPPPQYRENSTQCEI